MVIQEQAQRQGDEVRIGSGNRPTQNVRYAGEDLARGQIAIPAGTRLMAAELGLVASLGAAEVSVRRRVRVAFFSTGDELRSIGEPLGPGEVYDSNRYTLYAMLSRMGVELIDMGVVRDRPETIEQAFREAVGAADVVITSGGVSVGEADYVKETLARLGEVDFGRSPSSRADPRRSVGLETPPSLDCPVIRSPAWSPSTSSSSRRSEDSQVKRTAARSDSR